MCSVPTYFIHFCQDDGTYVEGDVERASIAEAEQLAEAAYASGMFIQVEIATWYPDRAEVGAAYWLNEDGWLMRADETGDIVDIPARPVAL